MTRDELLKALELAPDAGIVACNNDMAEISAQTVKTAPASPTALTLDDWSVRRGAESLSGDVMCKALKIEPDDMVSESDEHAAADFLAAAFEPTPKLAESCQDETRHRYLSQLLETEEYQALHADTQLDEFASELAAGHFAQGWVALKQDEEARQDPPDGPSGDGTPDPGSSAKRDLAALRAAAEALQGAQQDVDDLRDAQRSLGGDGGGDNRLPLTALRARFERIKQSGSLHRIMRLAGRYRLLAQAKQRQKVLHGRDDMVGVELGADLGRIVPTELACLADEDLEWDALRRLHERGMLQREYRGVESKQQGPIVVVVDESGSMSGEPIETAKAFALAMAWIAKHQRRWITLVGFSGGTEGTFLAMPPDKWDDLALMDWLEHFFSGGTTLDVPLEVLPSRWQELGCPAGKTDVIQITDALVELDPLMKDRFLAWKAEHQVKFYTLVLGSDEPGDLAQVSDRIWCLEDLSIEQDAIQELMSI